MFSTGDVRWFLDQVRELDIAVWIDGGWAVDALVGTQTREHQDIDIVLAAADSPPLQDLLESQGFVEVELDQRRPFNFVYGHLDGRKIDFHLFEPDERGNGVYGDTGEIFSAQALSGRGCLAGRDVRCIEPSTLVRFHTGYAHDADDVHDVMLLCNTFGIEVPEQYR